MYLEKIFKSFIVADLIFFGIFFVEFFNQSEEVSTIADQLSLGIFDSDSGALIALSLVAVILILYLISIFMLYKFMSFGKILYTFIIIASLLMIVLSGPTISTSLGSFIDAISGLIEGAILTLLYFTPIKDKFVK